MRLVATSPRRHWQDRRWRSAKLLLGFGLSVAELVAFLILRASYEVYSLMPRGLDEYSRATIGRIAIEACISAVLGSFIEIGPFVGADGWLALYALCCGVFALRRGDRFLGDSFNY